MTAFFRILIEFAFGAYSIYNSQPANAKLRFGSGPMLSQDLLEILRCPHCVSSATRHPGDDPGRLTLVRETWLVCQEPDCGRKYPIVDDIPVMLVDTGDKWINTKVEDLPVPPPEP